MATLVRRGRRWQAVLRLVGLPSRSRTFATRTEAKAWADEQEDAIRNGAQPELVRGSLAEALSRYARDVSPTKRGERWEKIRLTAMQRNSMAHKSIAEIRPADIALWRDARLREVAPGTVAREMKLLRSVFEIARKEWEMLRINPMSDVKPPMSPPARRRRISQDEIDRLMLALGVTDLEADTVRQRVGLAFLFALETAMRAGEILGLRRADVSEKSVRLPRTKNGDVRTVPLSKRAREILAALPSPASKDGLVFNVKPEVRDALFRKAREAAEITNLHFHDSRAEAIWRLSKKLDVMELARMIGHRDLKSLMMYYNASPDELADRLG